MNKNENLFRANCEERSTGEDTKYYKKFYRERFVKKL